MKNILWIVIISLLMLPTTSSALYTFSRDNFDTHTWYAENYGGETPTLSFDSTRFPGRAVIKVAFTGTGSYGFLRTTRFPVEDWSKVTAVLVDIYYEDATTGNNPTSSLEAKKTNNGGSVEKVTEYLTKNAWDTYSFSLNTALDYSSLSWVILNVESFLGFSAMTAYFDNMRLVMNDGSIKSWDNFDINAPVYIYGGSYDTSKFDQYNYPGGLETRSHNQAYPGGTGCSNYVAWNWTGGGTYAEIAQAGLSENWNTLDVQTVQYQLWTTNTSARYKIFLYDGAVGFAPVSQTVSSISTWVTLNFDVSSSAIANSVTPTFNRSNINQFKFVVEYLDVAGAATGECYFDVADTLDTLPVELSNFEAESAH